MFIKNLFIICISCIICVIGFKRGERPLNSYKLMPPTEADSLEERIHSFPKRIAMGVDLPDYILQMQTNFPNDYELKDKMTRNG